MIKIRHVASERAADKLVDKLLRDRELFLVITVRETDVHFGTKARRNSRNILRLRTQPDQTSNGLVDSERGADTSYLQLDLLAVDRLRR
jgi:hypothetical protein